MKALQRLILFTFLVPCLLKAQVQCFYSASALHGCPPLVVNFTDLSIGNPTNHYWDYDDGTTSTQQNPSKVFTNPGTYNVKHRVSDGTSVDSCYIQIHVYTPPTVNFTAPDARGCINPCHTVHFQNQTVVGESSITEYVWNFGDGSMPVTLLPPFGDTSHCYSTAGAYPVTLVVRDSNTCQSTKTINAVKIGNHPNVTASASPTQSCTSPAAISFIANGSTPNGGPVSYRWFFCNGSTSLLQNPSTVFYNGSCCSQVVLIDTLGCTDTAVVCTEISQVQAGFDTTFISNACAKGIQFTDTSNFASNWLWSFGDGTTSTQQNPFHTYSSTGSYTVMLTVSYNGCLNSITKSIIVTSNSSMDFFVLSSFALCPPFPVQFYNSGDSSLNYFWDFGDSTVSTAYQPLHVYTSPGNYDVKLIVVDSTGTCRDTVTEDNFIRVRGPIGNFSLSPDSGNVPLTVTVTGTMSNTESYIVDMGDGGFFTDSLPVQYTYMQGGTYYPVITLTDSLGCTITYLVDTVVCTGTGVAVQNINNSAFKLYPNPAGETLVIELAEETEAQLKVYNVFGQEVLNRTLSTKTTMVNIAHLPNGIYRVSVTEHGIIPSASLFIKQ